MKTITNLFLISLFSTNVGFAVGNYSVNVRYNENTVNVTYNREDTAGSVLIKALDELEPDRDRGDDEQLSLALPRNTRDIPSKDNFYNFMNHNCSPSFLTIKEKF